MGKKPFLWGGSLQDDHELFGEEEKPPVCPHCGSKIERVYREETVTVTYGYDFETNSIGERGSEGINSGPWHCEKCDKDISDLMDEIDPNFF